MILSQAKIKKRTILLLSFFLLCLAALVLRVAYWQLVRGEELKASAERQQTGSTIITPARGNIYDRNGKVLAESAAVSTLVCNPQDVKEKGNAEVIAEKLSLILDMDYETIYKDLTRNNRYQVIKKRLSADETEQIKALQNSENSKETAKAFSGVYFEDDSKRYYKYNTAAHLLGFTGYDSSGQLGIELTFDKELSGQLGSVLSAQSARGTTISDIQYESYYGAAQGADIVTTIDETIQQYLESALERAVVDYQLKEGACGVIMDPKTGEVLAMATKPDFDVNNPYEIDTFEKYAVDFEFYSDVLKRTVTKDDDIFAESKKSEQDKSDEDEDGEEQEKKISDLTEEERKELIAERKYAMQNKMWRNKAISDAYEPGSTFKIITAAAALEEGVVNLDTPFTCNGFMQIGNYKINCHNTSGHGNQTFLEGVQHSCNPVFMQTGMKLGGDKFMEYFAAFGFTDRTGIELVGESNSIYYKDKELSATDIATSSFGQGFNVTPIQMVTAISAAVNGGYRMKPQIVKEIRNENGVIKSYKPEVVNKVISEQTSKTLREVLESVVSSPEGTGKNAYIEGYRIGGKTGTSEKGDRKGDRRIASFAGFAPADDPQIVCLIMLDEPQTANKYGGTLAAPLAGQIMEEVLEYLGVERQYAEGEEAEKSLISVPDVRDLSIADAKKDITGAGFDIKIRGEGDTVVSQLPKPGVMLNENSFVIIYTEDGAEEEKVEVPSVIDLSIEDARDVLRSCGLNFQVSGAGQSSSGGEYAYKQSIEPGEKVSPATVIGVEFRHKASD